MAAPVATIKSNVIYLRYPEASSAAKYVAMLFTVIESAIEARRIFKTLSRKRLSNAKPKTLEFLNNKIVSSHPDKVVAIGAAKKPNTRVSAIARMRLQNIAINANLNGDVVSPLAK